MDTYVLVKLRLILNVRTSLQAGGMTSRQSVVVLELAQFAVIEFGECEEFVGER